MGAVGTLTDNESLLRLIKLQTEMSAGVVLVALLGITSRLGSLLGAFLVTYVSRGRDGGKRLWKRFWDVRLAGEWLINAKGSILMAALSHAMINATANMFPGRTSNPFCWVFLILTVVVVLVVYGPQKLVREPQGASPQAEGACATSDVSRQEAIGGHVEA